MQDIQKELPKWPKDRAAIEAETKHAAILVRDMAAPQEEAREKSRRINGIT